MKAKAIVFTGAGRVDLAAVDLPAPGPGELLLEAVFTGISPGTELRTLAGKQGGGTFPLVPGYSMVAKIIGRGPGVKLAEGSHVFAMGSDHCAPFNRCWAGHMSHAVCGEASVSPIPDGVDLAEASVSKLASIPYHGLRLARPLPEEKVAVIGLGAIGLMAAIHYSRAGCDVAACDLQKARVDHATGLGLRAAVAKASLKETFAPFFPSGADLLVDCSGVSEVFPRALEVLRELPWDQPLRQGPRCVIQGSYADAVKIPYDGAFLRELSVVFPRSDQDRDRLIIYDMMKRGALSLKAVLSDVREPEAAQKTYDELGKADSGLVSAAFSWKK